MSYYVATRPSVRRITKIWCRRPLTLALSFTIGTGRISRIKVKRLLFQQVVPNALRLAKQFILELLKSDPSERPTAQDALKNPWLVVEADKERDLSGLRENFSPRAKWKNAIDAVRAAGRISALARSHSHLVREQTGDSFRTDESGGWGPSRHGTGLRDGRTTSDEEEDAKEDSVGEEWEVKSHRHNQSSASTLSQKEKVAGASIHEGHAHALPDKAGDMEPKPAPTAADEDSDDGPHVPGAFLWRFKEGLGLGDKS